MIAFQLQIVAQSTLSTTTPPLLPTFGVGLWLLPMALLLVAGATVALLLRWAGLERPGTLAGLLVGILCGSTVFARIAPEFYNHHFEGGIEERAALADLTSRQGADVVAMTASGVSPAAFQELKTQHLQEQVHLIEQLDIAQRNHTWGMRCLLFILAGFLFGRMVPRRNNYRVMLGSGSNPPPLSPSKTDPKSSKLDPADAILIETVIEGNDTWHTAIFSVVWMHVVVVATVGLAMLFLFPGDRMGVIAASLCFAMVGSGMPPLDLGDREVESSPPLRLLRRIRVAAWLAAVLFFAIVIRSSSISMDDDIAGNIGGSVGNASGEMSPALTALILGIFAFHAGWVSRIFWIDANRTDTAEPSSITAILANYVLVPFLTACAIIRFDAAESRWFLPVVFGFVIGGDGRWLGIASGLRFNGLRWGQSLRLSTPFANMGAIQIIALTICMLTGILTDQMLIVAIVIGAVSCDVLANMRSGWVEEAIEALNDAKNRDATDE